MLECLNLDGAVIWIDIQTGVVIEKITQNVSITLVSWEDMELSLIAKHLKNQVLLRSGVPLGVGLVIISLVFLWVLISDRRKQQSWNIPITG